MNQILPLAPLSHREETALKLLCAWGDLTAQELACLSKQLPSSKVYSVLADLTGTGEISIRLDSSSNKDNPRVLYSITERGRNTLRI